MAKTLSTGANYCHRDCPTRQNAVREELIRMESEGPGYRGSERTYKRYEDTIKRGMEGPTPR